MSVAVYVHARVCTGTHCCPCCILCAAQFELRYKEVDRARQIFERYVQILPSVKVGTHARAFNRFHTRWASCEPHAPQQDPAKRTAPWAAYECMASIIVDPLAGSHVTRRDGYARALQEWRVRTVPASAAVAAAVCGLFPTVAGLFIPDTC